MKNQEWFSPQQRRVVAAGVTVLCTTLVLCFIAAVLWGLLCAFSKLSSILIPMLTALFFAVLLKGYYNFLRKWLVRLFFKNRRPPHMLVVALLFLSIGVPLFLTIRLFGSILVAQIVSFVDFLPTLSARVYHWVTSTLPSVNAFIAKYGLDKKIPLLADPQSVLSGWIDQVSLKTLGNTALVFGVGAVKYVISLVGWFVVPIYLCYFLAMPTPNGAAVQGCQYLQFLGKEKLKLLGKLVDNFWSIIIVYFQGQVVVALIQGVLFGLGFWVVGLPYGFLIGFVLGLLNLIPYLGSMIGLTVALPIACFGEGGGMGRVALVMAVFVAVQCLEGYVITPRIQGKKMKLSDVEIIFSLLFWGVVFQGVLGVLLAIPLSAFVKASFEIMKEPINGFLHQLVKNLSEGTAQIPNGR
ncbi:MAG: AI-2E family transporter [Kiritimatiellae bacterium]|nr:AI-2E family transporter [Kiritimatiellia bacterium]